MAKIQSIGKAAAINTLLSALTGESAQVTPYNSYVEITLSKNQKDYFKKMLEDMLTDKQGDISIVGIEDILIPVLIKKFGMYALAPLALGFIIGKV